MNSKPVKKKIVFLTGTRADFGKLKSLIKIADEHDAFEVHLFVTGMHLDEKYGYTIREIEKNHYGNIYKYENHDSEEITDLVLSRTVEGFSSYVRTLQPDLIVVHGDRIEALAGATVGALNNVLVAHIEGGELSGTVDELIRHAVSKLSHTHFVANEEASKRLLQMGELAETIFVIGSPDMDVMLSKTLPPLELVKKHYEVDFDTYAISLFHPVTTELEHLPGYTKEYFDALERSQLNYIIIYPNNDKGSSIIMDRITLLQNKKNFRIFPSVRFENFLALLKHAQFIIGNSSAGIREAPYYGVSTINVGTRQNKRSNDPDIIHCAYDAAYIMESIQQALTVTVPVKQLFGNGNSDKKFLKVLLQSSFWETRRQKLFADKVFV